MLIATISQRMSAKRRGARGMSRWASDAAERNRHVHRSWTSSNEEGWLCLRLLDARTRAHARLHLRLENARYARNVEIRSRREDDLERAVTRATVDEFVRLAHCPHVN